MMSQMSISMSAVAKIRVSMRYVQLCTVVRKKSHNRRNEHGQDQLSSSMSSSTVVMNADVLH